MFAEAFGYRDRWVAQVCDRVAVSVPVAASAVGRALIGLAVEYAIGLDLDSDGYAARRALLPPDQQRWVADQVELYRAGRIAAGSVSDEPAVGLLCAAFWLARWDDLLFHGAERGTSPQVIRDVLAGWGRPAEDPDWPLAVPELGEGFHRYATGPRAVLASHRPVVVAPVLARRLGPHGWDPDAIANVIVAEVLVEVKAGVVGPDAWRSGQPALQLMRYALLAPAAGYAITTVALYLARYGLLLAWRLTSLARQLAGHPVDLDRLRARLTHR